MFRIALCDDNQAFLEYERDLICCLMTERKIEFQCNVFLSGQELIQTDKVLEEYDLFILDYEMDGLNGFETARKIYDLSPEAKIAFATNYYDFTREGYKYNAVRYLVKQERSFKTDLIECIEHVLRTERKKTILLELSDGVLEVALDDIVYITSNRHYIEYFVKERKTTFYIRRCSLDDALRELPKQFIRVHQRFVVNLKNAKQIKGNQIIITTGKDESKEIPIARNRFDEVNRQFCLAKGEIL